MVEHDRWFTLAALLVGAAGGLGCIDGILLWQLQTGASAQSILFVVKIGMIATLLLTSTSLLIQIIRRRIPR